MVALLGVAMAEQRDPNRRISFDLTPVHEQHHPIATPNG
jgi:hypothetical protein